MRRNPEAFIAYQKGLEVAARGHEFGERDELVEFLAANRFFERTIELEPGYSAAYFDHADYYIHFVTSAADFGADADEIAAALEAAETDLRNAARTATTEGDRLNATLELTLISEQWRRLPELLSAAYRSSDCIAASWWGGAATILDPSDDLLAFWQRSVACDPLNFSAWSNLAGTQFVLGDHQGAIDTAKRGLAVIPHLQITAYLIYAYLAAGQFDDALATNQRYVEEERIRYRFRFSLAAARGDAVKARVLLDELVENHGINLSPDEWAMLGERERANQLAGIEDAAPLGFLSLIIAIGNCACGAPFDLEVTPNFARLIDEAKFPWPPPSPIEWPLKDW